MKTTKGWVYFATSKKRLGQVKIGFSHNPLTRISVLGGGDLVAVQNGGKTLEKKLHHKFREFAIGHEWFQYSDPITEYVESLPKEELGKLPPTTHVAVKIDLEHYEQIIKAAEDGCRSVAHQLRLIFETYFNGGKQ